MPTFKVMTWNIENLFRPAAGAAQPVQLRFEQKLQLLADVINPLVPDVVALQEVGGLEPLNALQQALGGTYPHRAISSFPDPRGIRVAFLSKHPLQDLGAAAHIFDFPPGPALDIQDLTGAGGSSPVTHMSRGALQIRVTKQGLTVDVITAHLKSKLLSFPRPGGSSFSPRDENERAQVGGIALLKRTAEAVTLRIHANSLIEGNPQTAMVLLGDFNDVPEAQTSLLLAGPPGSEIGTAGFHQGDQGDDARLFSLAPLIPEGRRFSRIHRGRGELLDQIFASEELLPRGPDNRRRVPVVDSHIDYQGQLPSVGEDPAARVAEIAPDHAPVTAAFDL